MRDLQSAITSLRSAFLCASAALLIVACGDSDGPNQDTGSTSTQMTNSGDLGSGDPNSKKELGASCEANEECVSNKCRAFSVVPDPAKPEEKVEGKSCSACNADADCTDPAVGTLCSPTLGVDTNPGSLYYVCSKGELGDGCMDNSNCSESRICAPTIAGLTTCSECATAADCKDPAKPQCVVKNEGFQKAYRVCAAPLADGEFCSGKEGSDEECQNYCQPVSISLLPQALGVCSPCKEDSHCGANEKCSEPGVDIAQGKLTPSKCEPKPAGTTSTTGGETTTTTTTGDTSSMTTDTASTTDTTGTTT